MCIRDSYKVEQIKKPLENYRDIDAFKIYVSDLGLLCAKKDLAANDILYMVEEINDFKGGMAENYVNVQLTINGYHTYYWDCLLYTSLIIGLCRTWRTLLKLGMRSCRRYGNSLPNPQRALRAARYGMLS